MTATDRAVMEDAARERGTWSPMAMMLRMGILPANANADADAYADANAIADANANADAYADAHAAAHADADAYSYAIADANANADAYADAHADADANADADADKTPLNLSGGNHVKPGLYLFSTQSGNLVVLRIAWVRRVEGDEYEGLHMVTPIRNDYSKMFADAAIDGPPKGWKYTRPLPRSSPLNRFHILGPVSLDPSQWEDVCPRPEGWGE